MTTPEETVDPYADPGGFLTLTSIGPVLDIIAGPVQLRCPNCRQVGSFEHLEGGGPKPIVDIQETTNSTVHMGHRRCPNRECSTHVFVVTKAGPSGPKVIRSFPPERIDFDDSDIPNEIRETFKEAIECHANGSYRSSAIMVRRTIEVLCDEKNAKGDKLYERIDDLGQLSSLPKAFIDAMHDVRYLGNDAAHIAAKTYNNVGAEEVRVAIAVVKELLKSVYQFEGLLKDLKALQT